MGQSSKEERDLYNRNLKYKWDNKSVMDYAVEQATEKGIDEGFERGIEQGRKQGIENERREFAIQMLADNEPLEKIVRFTKLTISEIENL